MGNLIETLATRNKEAIFCAYNEQLQKTINFAIDVHATRPKPVKPGEPSKRVRRWDEQTPFIMHPIFCGMMILSERCLTDEQRYIGSLALILHDVLEDTTITIDEFPEWIPVEVKTLVEQMSFESIEQEREAVEKGNCDPFVVLLKAYDKVSNLLDGNWMKNHPKAPEKWNKYVDYTLKTLVRQAATNFSPELNIVKLGMSVCVWNKPTTTRY